MNWNDIGKNIRKTPDGISNKVFGVMNPSKSLYLKIPRKARFFRSSYLYEQAEKILQEIELEKSITIEFVRRFQNR